MAEASRALPGFPMDLMTNFLGRRTSLDETSLIRQFRDAVREGIRDRGLDG